MVFAPERAAMWYNWRVNWMVVIAWYGLASAATLAAFWMDKKRAAAGRWRVPEKTLHLMELAGGWPGALVGIKWLRHKNRKAAYWVVTALIAVGHVAGWGWWVLKR